MLKFVLIFLLSANSFALENISLQLQWLNQFQFAGFYIAKEYGFYTKQGLNVAIKPYQSNLNPADEVNNGNADYALGRTSLLLDKAKGKDILLLSAIFQHSPLIILTNQHIKTIHDLKNKRLMNTNDVALSVALRAMLNANNINLDKDIIQTKHSFNAKDIANGKTDAMVAYSSNEPFLLQQLGIKFNSFSPNDYGFDFYGDLLFTSTDELKNHPKRVDKFIQASALGWQWAFANIEQTAQLIFNKYNTQNKTLEALIYEGRVLKKLALVKGIEFGNINLEKLKHIYQIYQTLGFIKTNISIENLVYYPPNLLQEMLSFLQTHLLKILAIIITLVFIFYTQTLFLKRKIKQQMQVQINQEKIICGKNKLMVLGEMIANIAHQWRQPLANINNIILNIDKYNKNQLGGNDYLEKKITDIENSCEYMSKTIDSFSSYLALNNQAVNFNLADIISQSITITRPMLDKNNIIVKLNIKQNSNYYGYDSDLIQVLVSIINNTKEALKNTDNKQLEIILNGLKITLKDNGKGIDEKIIQTIFKPHTTTRKNTLNRGLGLYIAHMIIKDKFLGEIKAYNSKGAVFEIILPPPAKVGYYAKKIQSINR